MQRKIFWILLAASVGSVAMAVADGLLLLPYAWKSGLKILVFGGLMLAFFAAFPGEQSRLKRLLRPKGRALVPAAVLTAAVYAAVLIGYRLLKEQIDLEQIRQSLEQTAGVNAGNFIWVAAYIVLVNSFLEEIFFRGFAFLTLKNYVSARRASAFSALCFAAYHGGMLRGWFHPLLTIAAFAGLFAAGCFFNRLDEKSESIYPAWMVHAGANLAINTVGFLMMEIL